MAFHGGGQQVPPDLAKRIEIMAEHIARNGSDFEHTVKSKNMNNQQFAFLYGGEGADYYQQVLASHQNRNATGGIRPGGQQAPQQQQQQQPSATPQQQQQPAGDGEAELAQLVQKWKEPFVYPLNAQAERELGEVANALEAMASRDAIRSGRQWIETNAAIAGQVAGNIMKRIGFLQSCSHRLHILYLVHDVLQTEAARKDAVKPLIRGFKLYLVWILRPCFQLAKNAGGEEGGKVLRLLQLWVERSIISTSEAQEMRILITVPELPQQQQQMAAQPGMQQQQQRPMMRPPPMPPAMPRPVVPGGPGMPSMAAMMAGGRPVGAPAQMAMQNRPQMMMQQGFRDANGNWQQGQVVMPGQPGMPVGMPGQQFARPTLAGYRPQMMQAAAPGKQTPETVPVGVMATMLRQAMRRTREQRQEFAPYKPLETQFTPQMLPPMEVPTPRLMERVQDFYEDLRDEERGSSSSRSGSRSRSRRRSRSSSSSRSRKKHSRSRSRDAYPAGLVGAAVPPPVLD